MATSDAWRREGLDRLLDVVGSLAAFMEATARLEAADASGAPDYGNLLVSEAYVRFLREDLPAGSLEAFVAAFHALGPTVRELLHAPPTERVAAARRLQDVVRRSREFTRGG